ncbi:MAG: hypothetical protein Q9M36_02365, partial [Sulfurovum sp.]|nr:hypothetical protein [Sulfurovum sp.]
VSGVSDKRDAVYERFHFHCAPLLSNNYLSARRHWHLSANSKLAALPAVTKCGVMGFYLICYSQI